LSAQVGTEAARINPEVDLTKYAPISVVNELHGQLAALSAGAVEDRVEKLVEQGKADGRIIGDEYAAYLTSMGKKDFAALSSLLASARPIAALTGMQTGGNKPVDGEHSGLTEDELAVCSALNVDVNDFKKTKAA